MSARKQATARVIPQPAKNAKIGRAPSYQDELLRWRFGHSDFDGPWCPRKALPGESEFLFTKLSEFDNRKWSEIEGKQSHAIDVVRLGRDAQKRLNSSDRLREIETLVSLRFGGKIRLWGIRENATFVVLWWDPEHEVYPVEKKHT